MTQKLIDLNRTLRDLRMHKFSTASRPESKPNKEKLDWTPMKKIPNVRKFKVILSEWDPVLLKHGIKKREFKPKLIFIRYKNHKLNKYIEHQLRRLLKHINNPKVYFTIGMSLVNRSNVLLVMACNKIYNSKWHRDVPLSEVCRELINTRKIGRLNESNLDYRRVYLEEEDKQRPLGVPTPSWRMYLVMMNWIIMFYLKNKGLLSDNQHGYTPRRGVMSIWIKILTEVIKEDDIWEFDLAGFFDGLSLENLNKQLRKYGIPDELITRIFKINKSLIKMDCHAERVFDSQYNTERETMKHKRLLNPTFKGYRGDPIFIPKLNPIFKSYKKVKIDWNSSKSLTSVGGNPNLEWIDKQNIFKMITGVRGVPQGSPLSPTLSAIALKESILKEPIIGHKILMYADDGIKYGKGLSDKLVSQITNAMWKAGVIYKEKKCRWVKKDGKWLEPLKFCGLEYDGKTGILSANTRKGAKLKYNMSEVFNEVIKERALKKASEILRKALKDGLYDKTGKFSDHWLEYLKDHKSWEALIKHKLFGFMQARLFNNSWDSEEVQQLFELTNKKNSWIHMINQGKVGGPTNILSVFNSTTFACEWLVNWCRRNYAMNNRKPSNHKTKYKVKKGNIVGYYYV